ncbi:hypothetical protein GCM10020255_071240 [Rhodococcus baikonurensis]
MHNEFEYRSYSWLVDVDDLPELPKALRPLATFDAGDHLGDPTRSIRANVETFLATNGVEFAGGRILMLANARVLGHVFNPLSVFWCLNDDGSQRCVVAEVHNTYGERHCYLLETDERGGARTSKEFYVSPFNDLDGEYRMRLPLPDTALALSIVLARDGKAPFVATVSGRCAGDDARDRPQCARHPAGSAPSRRADQISRNPAVGQALTHRSPTATSPAGGSAMTTTTLGTEPSAHTIETERWPGVATVPSGLKVRVASPVARALFHKAVARLPLRVQMPNGEFSGGGSPDSPLMVIHRPDDFAARVGDSGLIGFGESYMAGDWEASDLTAVLEVFASRVATLIPDFLQRLRGLYIPKQPRSERNSTQNTRSNISRHYDLSNEMFELFLDDTMTYSSALFEDLSVGATPSWDVFAAAQHRKIDRLLDGAGVGPGSRVLEIGTGWGELAIRAAQRGATVRSVTLSVEQQELAAKRISAAGLADRVQVDLLDYRQVQGSTTPSYRSR